jgi:hypothetical protein
MSMPSSRLAVATTHGSSPSRRRRTTSSRPSAAIEEWWTGTPIRWASCSARRRERVKTIERWPVAACDTTSSASTSSAGADGELLAVHRRSTDHELRLPERGAPHPTEDLLRGPDGGREPDALEVGVDELEEALEQAGQLGAPGGADEGVHLVDHHRPEAGEQRSFVVAGRGEQQLEALGRREEGVVRVVLEGLPGVGADVAVPGERRGSAPTAVLPPRSRAQPAPAAAEGPPEGSPRCGRGRPRSRAGRAGSAAPRRGTHRCPGPSSSSKRCAGRGGACPSRTPGPSSCPAARTGGAARDRAPMDRRRATGRGAGRVPVGSRAPPPRRACGSRSRPGRTARRGGFRATARRSRPSTASSWP